ncbi:MAG: ribosome biogenesis GTP-binding protein YihA/YsxC [Syntrophales bacterium LBB04]|nr:ribosome biogenesis GTP-binding protein YihA/YsxC [Syntrophales bacterium LBB04]
MKIVSAQFIKSAVLPSQYAETTLPEIAFAGKSNVGKSSLINALTQRKGLAKTSNSPGCTQLINFFIVNDQISLVDLPGYGFAKVPEAVKRNWGPMVEAYLKGRHALRLVVFLLDIRRDPGEHDLTMMRWFEFYRIPYVVVLTKTDKVSKQQVVYRRKIILNALDRPEATTVLFSIKTGAGKEGLWKEIEKYTGILPINKLKLQFFKS